MNKKVVKSRSKKLSVCATPKKEVIYEKDFFKWTQLQASLLKKKQFDKIDLENIVEEIETLGRSNKGKLNSFLVVLLQHLLKNTYTPENKGNSRSWDATILNSKNGIKDLLLESPSLKPILNEIFYEAYERAREIAIIETNSTYIREEIFPEECPWTIEELFPYLKKKNSK